MLNKWFRFALNKNKIVMINFDLISTLEFTLNTVIVGEFELTGEDAERFRKELDKYNNYVEGLVRVKRNDS